MRRKKLASGVMMLALLGFTAERSHAGQEVVDQGQGEVIIDQEQEVVAEQEQEVIVDQGQGEVIVEQEQEVVVEQEQEVIIDPKKGGYHHPIEQCKASNPPVNGQCPQTPPPPPCRGNDPTPTIKPGECWSQCIVEGKSEKIYKPVKTCINCEYVVPNGTKPIDKKVVKEIVTPGEQLRQCQLRRSGKFEWIKVADAQYGPVTIQDCKPRKFPVKMNCTYVIKSVTVAYEKPTISHEIKTHPIWFQSNWEVLIRKPGTCPDGKGGIECSDVCSEIRKRPFPVKIEKCINKPGVTTKYITKDYKVKVCEPVNPQPPPHVPCPTIVKQVMKVPPQYKKVEIMEKACDGYKVITGPPKYTYGHVTFHVPNYRVVQKPPVIDCIGVPTQVCKPVLAWRQEAMCLDDGKNHAGLITQVQEALVQEGFDAGPADGVLNDKTKQAIVDFQKAKGLAQGGTLTKETVEALGISQ